MASIKLFYMIYCMMGAYGITASYSCPLMFNKFNISVKKIGSNIIITRFFCLIKCRFDKPSLTKNVIFNSLFKLMVLELVAPAGHFRTFSNFSTRTSAKTFFFYSLDFELLLSYKVCQFHISNTTRV